MENIMEPKEEKECVEAMQYIVDRMQKAEEENKKLKSIIFNLIGASTKEELQAMKDVLMNFPVGDESKNIVLEGIDAAMEFAV
jgi:hypothetical protein